MPIRRRHLIAFALLAPPLAGGTACGGGSATPVPADSAGALAADLRLAAAAVADSGTRSTGATSRAATSATGSAATGAWTIGETGVPRRAPSPASASPATSASTAAAARPVDSSGAAGSATRSWCASPTAADQQRCLNVYLTAYDARLNSTYQALITALSRRDGGTARGREPASVRALRAQQRAWIVARDVACQREGRGVEGALWAPSRARCLGARATTRADSLAEELARLGG